MSSDVNSKLQLMSAGSQFYQPAYATAFNIYTDRIPACERKMRKKGRDQTKMKTINRVDLVYYKHLLFHKRKNR